MHAALDQVLVGLANGAIYASVALALVMIYRSTHQLNFAQGELAMFCTYVAWALLQAGLPYWSAFVLTVAAATAIGAALHFFVLRPLGDASPLRLVVVFVGLLLIFNSIAGWIFSYDLKSFPSPFRGQVAIGAHSISAHEVGATAVTLVVLALLVVFFRFTPLGLKMRAAAQNPQSSRLVGIRVGRMFALGWGLAAAVGALAGMMVAPAVYLEPNMMSGVLVYAFAAALLGGIESPAGAVAGGFIVGVLENLIGVYVIGNELKLSVALAVIIIVLLVRPTGLFGRAPVDRV